MLQHDYLLEIISQFVDAISRALLDAVGKGSLKDAKDAEQAIAGVLDLDPNVALRLSPDSLVTMMLLSGVGESLAGYVAYALRKLSQAYDGMGEDELSDLRLSQARAVEESFNSEPGAIPEEFKELEGKLEAGQM